MKSPIQVEHKGNFSRTLKFLLKLKNGDIYRILDKYARIGTENLRNNTPIGPTGRAAASWYHEVEVTSSGATITWCNDDVEGGRNVIVLLEYGHGTKNGGWVEGIDIIDPSLSPVFDKIVKEIWKEVEK